MNAYHAFLHINQQQPRNKPMNEQTNKPTPVSATLSPMPSSTTDTSDLPIGYTYVDINGYGQRWNGDAFVSAPEFDKPGCKPLPDTSPCTPTPATYDRLRGNDALAHLNEVLAGEIERYERDCGLRVASIKVVRVKDDDALKGVKCHVR